MGRKQPRVPRRQQLSGGHENSLFIVTSTCTVLLRLHVKHHASEVKTVHTFELCFSSLYFSR